jgi:hypothetical protein
MGQRAGMRWRITGNEWDTKWEKNVRLPKSPSSRPGEAGITFSRGYQRWRSSQEKNVCLLSPTSSCGAASFAFLACSSQAVAERAAANPAEFFFPGVLRKRRIGAGLKPSFQTSVWRPKPIFLPRCNLHCTVSIGS